MSSDKELNLKGEGGITVRKFSRHIEENNAARGKAQYCFTTVHLIFSSPNRSRRTLAHPSLIQSVRGSFSRGQAAGDLS
jgi:hypothetical protein